MLNFSGYFKNNVVAAIDINSANLFPLVLDLKYTILYDAKCLYHDYSIRVIDYSIKYSYVDMHN